MLHLLYEILRDSLSLAASVRLSVPLQTARAEEQIRNTTEKKEWCLRMLTTKLFHSKRYEGACQWACCYETEKNFLSNQRNLNALIRLMDAAIFRRFIMLCKSRD